MGEIRDILPCPPRLGRTTNFSAMGFEFEEALGFFGFNISDFGVPAGENRSVGHVNQSCWDFDASPYSEGFKKIMDDLNIFITPIIIFIGITGNFLSFLVFTLTHLRRQSSSTYLASLAIVDIVFLLSLGIVWLSWIRVPLLRKEGWCQIVVYMTYVCTFLSVWLVTSFTVDRFIFCHYPLQKERFCSTRRARCVVVVLVLCGLLTYSFATWTSGVTYLHSIPLCMPFPRYYNMLTTITAIDSAVTLIIPCSLVIILNIRIVMRIMRVERKRRPFVRQLYHGVTVHSLEDKGGSARICGIAASLSSGGPVHVRFHNHTSTAAEKQYRTTTNDCNNAVGTPLYSHTTGHSAKKSSRCRSYQYRTARMLIIVSTVFVMLNVPGHVFRIHAFIQSSLHDEFSERRNDLTWHEIFNLVNHLNFSINFFIYSACGRQFRNGLKFLYTKIQRKAEYWRMWRRPSKPGVNL